MRKFEMWTGRGRRIEVGLAVSRSFWQWPPHLVRQVVHEGEGVPDEEHPRRRSSAQRHHRAGSAAKQQHAADTGHSLSITTPCVYSVRGTYDRRAINRYRSARAQVTGAAAARRRVARRLYAHHRRDIDLGTSNVYQVFSVRTAEGGGRIDGSTIIILSGGND
jgi:hypothetical protein